MSYGWSPYVPVARRRALAAREMQGFAKEGLRPAPVTIKGRDIARTFWGKAWCENLEDYVDYLNRLPRGRTYVRNGSVVHLALAPGRVDALVSGSRLYRTAIAVNPLDDARWKDLSARCAGAIDSVVELLQGRFAKGVMEFLCDPDEGIFPAPHEIRFSCTCPDWADMCKHVAAALYGVGARLDEAPELLFTLRQVDAKDLIAEAGRNLALPAKGPEASKVLGDDDLSELFGIEIGPSDVASDAKTPEPPPAATPAKAPRKAKKAKKAAPAKTEASSLAAALRALKRIEARTTAAADRGAPRERRKTRSDRLGKRVP